MSLECSECERDLRGGHAKDCSRHPVMKIEKLLAHHGNACRAGDTREIQISSDEILKIASQLYEARE